MRLCMNKHHYTVLWWKLVQIISRSIEDSLFFFSVCLSLHSDWSHCTRTRGVMLHESILGKSVRPPARYILTFSFDSCMSNKISHAATASFLPWALLIFFTWFPLPMNSSGFWSIQIYHGSLKSHKWIWLLVAKLSRSSKLIFPALFSAKSSSSRP